jgi:hypothetical protein
MNIACPKGLSQEVRPELWSIKFLWKYTTLTSLKKKSTHSFMQQLTGGWHYRPYQQNTIGIER